MDNELISQQIEELRAKQSTENIKIVNQNCFCITYSPQMTNSAYSHLVFNIKVIIPEKYPEAPPFLTFTDKIYHLNIDPITGHVAMPVLRDDWSPFLTLSNVFESLDNILEEPDPDFAATQILRAQYINEPEKYAEKVNQMVNLCTTEVKDNLNQSIVEHVEQIADYKSSEGILLNNSFEKVEEVPAAMQNSIPVAEIPINLKNIDESPIKQKGNQIRIQTLSFNNSFKTSQIQLKAPKQSPSQKVIKPISIQNEKNNMTGESLNVLKKSLSKKKSQAPESKEEFEQIQLNLKKSDQLIELLLEGCESMQSTVNKSHNSRVKELLQKKLEHQWKMVEQLLEISSKLKQKLFNSIKHQTRHLMK